MRRGCTKSHERAHTCASFNLPDNDVYSGPPSKRPALLGGSASAGLTLQFTMSFAAARLGLVRKLVFSAIAHGGGARRDRTDDLMLAKHALYQLSYGPLEEQCPARAVVDLSARGVTQCVVGPGRLELPTSRLSGVCSNQLSYRPLSGSFARQAKGSKRREYAIASQPSQRL